jgi:nucleoid DNA-binding protein
MLDINPNDKPIAMSVKDYLIKVMSIRMKVGEKEIEAVVNHQFAEALEATKKCNSLEFSGFGNFTFNEKKAKRKIEKLEEKIRVYEDRLQRGEMNEKRLEYTRKVIEDTIDSINYIKSKINETKGDLRGLEEQTGSTGGVEGGNSESVSREEINL